MAPEAPAETATVSEEYLEDILERAGALGPKPERVTEDYADTRIREKISRFESDRQRAGLWSINKELADRDVPAGLRLHLISAVVHLSRVGGETLEGRVQRSDTE